MKKQKSLLVIIPGKESKNCQFHLVVSNTGEILYSQLSGDHLLAKQEILDNRKERLVELKNRFSDFEIKNIDDTDIEVESIVKLANDFKNRK